MPAVRPRAPGIHGANRLASNSLLEGLVFGDRTVRELNRYLSVSEPAVQEGQDWIWPTSPGRATTRPW